MSASMSSNAQQLVNAANAANVPHVVITAFHKDVFTIATAGRKAAETMHVKMTALLKSRYGDVAPTYKQFREDRAALKSLADDKGLADDQWVRKPYNAALKGLYGALPAAQTAAALAKAKVRAALQAKSGAVKGETAPRRTSTPETIEQYVARVGVFKVLECCAKILEGDASTKAAASTLRTLKAA